MEVGDVDPLGLLLDDGLDFAFGELEDHFAGDIAGVRLGVDVLDADLDEAHEAVLELFHFRGDGELELVEVLILLPEILDDLDPIDGPEEDVVDIEEAEELLGVLPAVEDAGLVGEGECEDVEFGTLDVVGDPALVVELGGDILGLVDDKVSDDEGGNVGSEEVLNEDLVGNRIESTSLVKGGPLVGGQFGELINFLAIKLIIDELVVLGVDLEVVVDEVDFGCGKVEQNHHRLGTLHKVAQEQRGQVGRTYARRQHHQTASRLQPKRVHNVVVYS